MPATKRPTSPPESVRDALVDVFERLRHFPPDARTRALRAKAETYQRVVDRWEMLPPTTAQHDALGELVEELLGMMRGLVDEGDDAPPSSSRPFARVLLKKTPAGGTDGEP